MRKGILFVISGPSGAGKGTVLKEVFKTVTDLEYSVSATTRAPRNQEKEGVNYFFKTREEFDKMVKNGDMLEYIEKFGNKYGTIKSYIESALERGRDIILEIETLGAEQVRKAGLNPVYIFLTPSSVTELIRRLKSRNTETVDWQQRRVEIGRDELQCAYNYDYLVINDDLQKAVTALIAIIRAERQKVAVNIDKIQQIIDK
ncbi:MAG: guanylate kinase [Clostridia bacterium]|nr:guanylate kinase [Clostridia bacterium]